VSFAPTSASGRTNEAFAAISAMAYGPQHGAAVAGGRAWSSADSPYNVWASGFGGARGQKGDNLMLRSTSSAWGAAIGLDRQVRSDLLLGAFLGGGAGRLSTELNSQSIDTDYFGGGIYGRFDWSSYFLDFTVQAGATHNKSSRLVLNNPTPGGSETATASYNGWYVSPEVAFGRRYALDHGYSLTPVVRLRYLTGAFDGYSETGSVQNLSVGRRTLQDIEERAEIELAKITGVTTGALKTSVHGGLIALQRLGSPIVNTVLIGQDLSFTAPGKDSAAGVVAGVSFDLRAAQNVSLFGAFETTVMSDRSRTAAAKGGLRVMF
jgi:outer membrane autotransporter protein